MDNMNKSTIAKYHNAKIIGYILTLTIFTFVLFSVLAFDVEFKNRKGNSVVSNVMKVEASNAGFEGQFSSIYNKQELEPFQIDMAQEKIVSHTINNGKFPSSVYLDGEKKSIYDTTYNIKFVDLGLSSSIVPKSVEKVLLNRSQHGFIKAGTGFSGNGAGQLLISEAMMKELKLQPNCIGKKLSFTLDVPAIEFDNFTSEYAENITVLDDDGIVGNETANSVWNGKDNYTKTEFAGGQISIFKNYVIVGIINSEYEQIEHNSADIWMATPSLYNQNHCYLPKMEYGDIYNKDGGANKARIITYQNADLVALSNQATSAGMVFPFFLRGGSVSETVSRWSPISICDLITTYEVEYENYKDVKNIYTSQTKEKNNVSLKVRQDVMDMLRYDEEQKVIKIVLLLVGFIIGVITCAFSIKAQENNKKSIISVIMGSTGLSLAIVLFQCFAFNNFGGIQNWSNGLNFAFYPLAWLAINALVTLPIIIKLLITTKNKGEGK